MDSLCGQMDNAVVDPIAVFVKVVEAGSFSEAGRRLGLPKTTVSAKVAGLERRLGVRLIQRTTRKLRVTDAGQRYFHHCAIAIREVALGEAAMQSAKTKPYGVLKVTAPIDIGHSVLPRIARVYTVKYPDISLELIVTNRMVDLVEEGVDLAIRSVFGMKESSLIARRFLNARTDLLASPQYLKSLGKPTHPRDLANAAFVRPPLRTSVVLTNGKSDFEVQMNGRVLADDLVTIKGLTILGEGIAWLPDYLVDDAVEAGTLVRVLSQWRPKQRGIYYFVFPGRQYTLPKVEGFIQTALEVAATLPGR